MLWPPRVLQLPAHRSARQRNRRWMASTPASCNSARRLRTVPATPAASHSMRNTLSPALQPAQPSYTPRRARTRDMCVECRDTVYKPRSGRLHRSRAAEVCPSARQTPIAQKKQSRVWRLPEPRHTFPARRLAVWPPDFCPPDRQTSGRLAHTTHWAAWPDVWPSGHQTGPARRSATSRCLPMPISGRWD